MKPNLKSAFIITACVGFLAACDNIHWPHVYGPDEVPADVRDAPRPIPTAQHAPEGTPFPRLGDVPSHPKDFTPDATIDQTKQQMEDDRDEANAIKQKVQTPPSP